MSVEENFIESLKIINKLKIQAVLFGGVNLSLTRDKKFFEHEDNIDFFILRKNINKINISHLRKYFIKKKYTELKKKNKIVFKKNSIRVKFCILDKVSKFTNYYVHNNKLKILKEFIDINSLKVFKKNKYLIPFENEKYLSFNYDNWKEKPKFPSDYATYTNTKIYVNEKKEYFYKIYRILINYIKKII